jgi:hypothetical protein
MGMGLVIRYIFLERGTYHKETCIQPLVKISRIQEIRNHRVADKRLRRWSQQVPGTTSGLDVLMFESLPAAQADDNCSWNSS